MDTLVREGDQKRSISYRKDKCVGCGICTDICPTEALKLGPLVPIARGLVDMDYVNSDKDKCALCGLCAASCPFDALEFTINDVNIKDNDAYPQWKHTANIDDKTCIYCKACETACPRDAITVTRDLPIRSKLVSGEIEIDEETCIHCGICEELCPAEAITLNKENITAPEISIDKDKCVYCLVCKRACPVTAIKAACRTCSYGAYEIDPADAEISGNAFIVEDQCINCGWCQEICSVEAAEVSKPFEGEIDYIEDFECKGESCHACMDICPCNAVSIVDGKSVIEPKFCVLCGACAKACPQNGIIIKREKINLENVRSKSWQKQMDKLSEAGSK
ncbi:MAG: 4Fe-4S binding protein [Methanobacterium sp.]|nr:4Fe-4S binding protein [Methanobacterium sp.]